MLHATAVIAIDQAEKKEPSPLKALFLDRQKKVKRAGERTYLKSQDNKTPNPALKATKAMVNSSKENVCPISTMMTKSLQKKIPLPSKTQRIKLKSKKSRLNPRFFGI